MSLYVDIEKDLDSFKLKVELDQEQGILGLLGKSGCGKSMTLKCIAGIVKPDRGKIILDNKILFDSEKKINLPPQKRNIGFLFQNYALFPHMTVKENIQIGIEKHPNKNQIIKEYLKKFKLEGFEDRHIWQLSGGQKQRIALARALCVNPDILILDEPFSALDYHLRANMETELCDILKDFDGKVLFVTHDISEAYRVSDEIIVFDNGQTLPKRGKRDLFESPNSMTEAIITGCKNISRFEKVDDYTIVANDWKIKFKLDNFIKNNCDYIGIREHNIKMTSENVNDDRNVFEMEIVKIIENSFSYNIYVKRTNSDVSSLIQMEIEKNKKDIYIGQKINIKIEQEYIFQF